MSFFFSLLLDLHLNRLFLTIKKLCGGESEGVYIVFIEKLFLCLVGSIFKVIVDSVSKYIV